MEILEKVYKMNKTEIESFILENQKKATDWYLIDNRGFITASKLKMFEKSPEAYFVKYILELPLPADEEEEKDSLKLGTAIDDYISYGEEKFYKKYDVSEKKLLKADLVALCQENLLDSTGTVEVLTAILTENKIIWNKIKLTPSLVKKLFGMLNEWKRQPLFDYNGNYKTQVELITKYKNLNLKAKLDRLGVELGLLRDMKTTNNLEKFIYQVEDYGYSFSMSFYNILAKLIYKKDFTIILDACQSTAPHPSTSFIIPPETIIQVGNTRIIPVLEKLAKFTKKWEENKDPKVWLEDTPAREELYSLDTYPVMESALQKQFEYIQ